MVEGDRPQGGNTQERGWGGGVPTTSFSDPCQVPGVPDLPRLPLWVHPQTPKNAQTDCPIVGAQCRALPTGPHCPSTPPARLHRLPYRDRSLGVQFQRGAPVPGPVHASLGLELGLRRLLLHPWVLQDCPGPPLGVESGQGWAGRRLQGLSQWEGESRGAGPTQIRGAQACRGGLAAATWGPGPGAGVLVSLFVLKWID